VLIFHEAKHVIQSKLPNSCHDLPSSCLLSKFPGNSDATHAFQKVAVAYDVLSKPTLKRLYDNRSPSSDFDAFATRPMGHAEETFRGVILGVFNDFLDGDLEVIRTLLSLCLTDVLNFIDADFFLFRWRKRYQPLYQTW
jgi:curved DNA-binding protein CbpA